MRKFIIGGLAAFAMVAAPAAVGGVAAEERVTRLTDLRARCLAELHTGGWSLRRIASATGLSHPRVQQLVDRGSEVVP